jgi:hypothetical protein
VFTDDTSAAKTYDIGVTHIIAKIKPGAVAQTLGQLENKWKSFITAEPFDYTFLDSEFDAQYRSEQRLGNLFSVFASLSIFIACLGLFGLCDFMADPNMHRTAEHLITKSDNIFTHSNSTPIHPTTSPKDTKLTRPAKTIH